MPPALQFLVLTFAGWVNRHQDDLIDYLREENRVLREHLGPRPLRLTDAQRRRLAVRGHKLGRRVLTQVAGIVTPDTILRWYRRLIAKKYDGSAPPTSRSTNDPTRRRRARGQDGGRQSAVGLHADPRRALEPRPHYRPDHGEADPARPRSRPGARAEPAHALEDVPAGALGGPGGLRSVHRRGVDAGGAQAVPRLLRDRAEIPPRDHRRDPPAAGRARGWSSRPAI